MNEDRENPASEPVHEAPEGPLAPMDFSTFLLSLGSSAQVNLGLVPTPDGDTLPPNLPAAKQIIDIIAILEEKTRGNLDEAEGKLLHALLYDLRVQFCDAQKGAHE